MEFKFCVNRQFNMTMLFLLVPFLLVLCNGNENDNESVVFKSYGSNYCIYIENPRSDSKTHLSKPIVVLKNCYWTHNTKMRLSIHPVESSGSAEYEDEDNDDSGDKTLTHHVSSNRRREYIIRGPRSDCVITGSDNTKIKTGKCSVPSAKYFINTVYKIETGPAYSHSQPDLNTQHRHQQNLLNINLKNDNHNVAFKFEQQQKCLTVRMDEGRNNGHEIIMDPCNPDMKSQLWSICSLQGNCHSTYNFQTLTTTTVLPSTTTSSYEYAPTITEETVSKNTSFSSNDPTLQSEIAVNSGKSSAVTIMMDNCLKCIALMLSFLFYYASKMYC